MIFDVSVLENQEKYRLLNGGVTPRPIAWISTRSTEGIDNLAPYSFFTVASCNPPVLLYTEVKQRSGIEKDTLQNLMATSECVVNIVNSALLEKMNLTSASLNKDESEFDFANVERCASEQVMPRSVKDSPIRYECSLREIIPISDLPTGGTVILLDVKCVYVRDDLYEDGNINQKLIDSVGKMGGNHFSLTAKNIELKRP
ncbi:flavin reductase family protein [Colwellia sp. MB02u-18]|uniref:flavin reductase family protein n=1 Tax=unclassified Colwellia TaxID=196834 RepID=UPI0015F49E13|nr:MULTISPECIES: flavin reductase family protein [unclassified Colwellia]MBA6222788.1 flavin reductase family protein [Colwellia sp. MB3u-45]MBA6266005.1 flavin reductase family protein [Colwellia sp. MB3u-43]MBA6320445.1 flavin reductase family protein [Colwellia sp. MB02u-19]MBA6323332.1 flavin reductase family protein [Colwellia sp. MB02u-18]MBA6329830.1 flavin reductase family protein [Colwellia sp. MB02u-12]